MLTGNKPTMLFLRQDEYDALALELETFMVARASPRLAAMNVMMIDGVRIESSEGKVWAAHGDS